MIDVNANLAECIVRKESLTNTIVTNICNGSVTIVPHTAMDVALAGLLFAVLMGLIGFLIAMWGSI